MTPRRTNRLLWTAAAGLAGLVPVVLAAGVLFGTDAGGSDDVAALPHATATTTSAGRAEALTPAAFGASLTRRWRMPLAAAEPSGASQTPAAGDVTPGNVPAGRLQLVGTIGESVAMLKGPDGTVALVEVGDDVNGADVVSIGPDRIDLREGTRLLRLQKSAPAGAAARPDAGAGDIVIR